MLSDKLTMKNLISISLLLFVTFQAYTEEISAKTGEDQSYGNIVMVGNKARISPHYPVMNQIEYHSYLKNKAEEIRSVYCHEDHFFNAKNTGEEIDQVSYKENLVKEETLCSKIKTMPFKTIAHKKAIIKEYASFHCEQTYNEVSWLSKLDKDSNGMSKQSCLNGPIALNKTQVLELSKAKLRTALYNPMDLSKEWQENPGHLDIDSHRKPAAINKK
jgi:hypothetical protein